LDVTEQYYRHTAAKNIIKITQENKYNINKLTITKADKGKTTVILKQEEYEHKQLHTR
jgi:hypothetical protein